MNITESITAKKKVSVIKDLIKVLQVTGSHPDKSFKADDLLQYAYDLCDNANEFIDLKSASVESVQLTISAMQSWVSNDKSLDDVSHLFIRVIRQTKDQANDSAENDTPCCAP